MKFAAILYGSAALSLVAASPHGYKHGAEWSKKLAQIKARAIRPIDSPEDSFELIGDLDTQGATTPVGAQIRDILVGEGDPQSSETYLLGGLLLPPKGSSLCAKDTCCIWQYIANEMTAKFKANILGTRCSKYARFAVRAGFHDAGAWEKGLNFGGADGSLVLADERNRPENNGLQEIIAIYEGWFANYKQYGVSMADLIQMGATVATVVCPLGPRIRSYVGRKDSSKSAQDNLLPNVFASANDLIALFERKTIRPHGLTALVGAHTTSQQRFVDPSRALDPQDSTPGVWDVKFYGETLNPNAPANIFKFPADVKFSTHPRMADEWQKFADPKDGQDHWNDDFAKEYIRLSLLGVFNINNLTECTKVLPRKIDFVI